jgi:membrane dipeptidase
VSEPLSPASRKPPILFDGLIFRCSGWSAELDGSGLSALHLTVADTESDFAATCGEIARWWEILDDESAHFYPLLSIDDLNHIGKNDRIGVMCGLQNGIAVSSHVERIEILWRLGIRVLQFTYNDANLLADGCAEPRDGGLTSLGRSVVRECNRAGIIIDISHVGEAGSLQAVHESEVPVVATHANRRALANNPRNKRDEALLAIAASGGVVGISPWGPMCWKGQPAKYPTVNDFIQQIVATVELVGVEAVAIGTDLHCGGAGSDGYLAFNRQRLVRKYTTILADYTRAFGTHPGRRYCDGFDGLDMWPHLDAMLADTGMNEWERRLILGENWIRICRTVWNARARRA